MKTGKKIVKNTFALSFSTFMPRLVQTFLVFCAARMIGDASLGKYYTLASLVAILNLVTDFGLNGLIVRDVSQKQESAQKYFWNFFLVKSALAVVAYLSLIMIVILLGYPQDILQGAYIYGFYLMAGVFNGFLYSFWQAFEEMQYIGMIATAGSWANLLLGLILLFLGGDFEALIWGLLLSSLIALFLNLGLFSRKFSFFVDQTDIKFLKKIFIKAIPFALASIFTTLYFRIDIIILSKFKEAAVVGWYGSAYKILDVLQMLPHVIMGAVYPVLSRTYLNALDRFTFLHRQVLKILLHLAFPIAIGLTVLADQIILFLYGEDFIKGTLSLQILSWALFLIFLNSLFVITGMAVDKMKVVGWVAFLNILINTGLNLIFIPEWGLNLSLNGAAIATLANEIFAFGIYLWYLRKEVISIDVFRLSFKPFLASLAMGLVVYFSRGLGLWFAIGAGLLVYPTVLILIKGVTKEEMIFVKNLISKKENL